MTEKKNLNQEQLEKVSGGYQTFGYCNHCKEIVEATLDGGVPHCTICGGTDIVFEP